MILLMLAGAIGVGHGCIEAATNNALSGTGLASCGLFILSGIALWVAGICGLNNQSDIR